MTGTLIYVVNDDWFFMLHRIPTLRAAQRAGFDVALVTRVGGQHEVIEGLGVRLIDFPFDRQSRNPFTAIVQIARLAAIYRHEKPAIVHHIALKPILFGSVAAWLARVPCVVNGFVGLGTLFYGDILLARALRPVFFPLFRAFAGCARVWTLFENEDDCRRMRQGKMAHPDRSMVIPGSGVDTGRFLPSPLPQTPPFICMFAGRLIAMKGLQTIRDAFAILKEENAAVRLWVCGMPDPGNPQSWTADQMKIWCDENPAVIWKGQQTDMSAIWPQVHLALQPTIGGEGLPVSLLEAAACARPLIATDVPGCRDVVEDGVNGLLVPEEDAAALADAIRTLAADPECCAQMGEKSRNRVVTHFSSARVTNVVHDLYQKLQLTQAGRGDSVPE